MSNTYRTLLECTAEVVASYVSNNSIAADMLPQLIEAVHGGLTRIANGEETEIAQEKEALTPAVPIRKSVQPDYIICLEDGKKLKMLKRHLRTAYGMTPDEYRTRWGLPADYPMVAPNYAKARSELALLSGLGRNNRSMGNA